jgi:hypothetical protein
MSSLQLSFFLLVSSLSFFFFFFFFRPLLRGAFERVAERVPRGVPLLHVGEDPPAPEHLPRHGRLVLQVGARVCEWRCKYIGECIFLFVLVYFIVFFLSLLSSSLPTSACGEFAHVIASTHAARVMGYATRMKFVYVPFLLLPILAFLFRAL